jgi:quercetin 2,3-dioxygenase
MKTIIHKANSRGHADYGWLKTWHSFSFANYYHPERVHFGMLRVLNDDTIAPGEGFGMHPHDNMEIVTIPLEGIVEHKDSMGHATQLPTGEIQVMSAGTGVYHSEYNPQAEKELKLLQIWVFPEKRNTEPRYDQISLKDLTEQDHLHQIVSPEAGQTGAWIGQKAWFHLGKLSKGWKGEYSFKGKDTGLYAFLIEGKVDLSGQILERRDGLGISETEHIDINVLEPSWLLLMEVPMDANSSND